MRIHLSGPALAHRSKPLQIIRIAQNLEMRLLQLLYAAVCLSLEVEMRASCLLHRVWIALRLLLQRRPAGVA